MTSSRCATRRDGKGTMTTHQQQRYSTTLRRFSTPAVIQYRATRLRKYQRWSRLRAEISAERGRFLAQMQAMKNMWTLEYSALG